MPIASAYFFQSALAFAQVLHLSHPDIHDSGAFNRILSTPLIFQEGPRQSKCPFLLDRDKSGELCRWGCDYIAYSLECHRSSSAHLQILMISIKPTGNAFCSQACIFCRRTCRRRCTCKQSHCVHSLGQHGPLFIFSSAYDLGGRVLPHRSLWYLGVSSLDQIDGNRWTEKC